MFSGASFNQNKSFFSAFFYKLWDFFKDVEVYKAQFSRLQTCKHRLQLLKIINSFVTINSKVFCFVFKTFKTKNWILKYFNGSNCLTLAQCFSTFFIFRWFSKSETFLLQGRFSNFSLILKNFQIKKFFNFVTHLKTCRSTLMFRGTEVEEHCYS